MSTSRHAKVLFRALLSSALVGLTACVTAPTLHPPTPLDPGESVRAGVSAYDNAGPDNALGGATVFASYRFRDLLDVGGHLQLATESRTFLGGGLMSGLRLRLQDDVLLSLEMSVEYLEAFSYAVDGRAPQLLITLGAPLAFRFLEGTWVWVRPGLGAGATAYLFAVRRGPLPVVGFAFPSVRLSYGLSYELFDGVTVLGESSTSVPFGGAYLGFALMLSL